MPGLDGTRLGPHHAGHAVDLDQRLPRPGERAQAIRVWAASPGRHRHRADRGWLAARALLLGLGVHGERPDRRRRARRRAGPRARFAGRRPRRARPRRAVLSIAGVTALVWSIIEAPAARLDRRSLSWFAGAAVLLAAFVAGSCGGGADARPAASSPTCGSPRPAWRSRSRSSRSSGLLPPDPVPAVVRGYAALDAGCRRRPRRRAGVGGPLSQADERLGTDRRAAGMMTRRRGAHLLTLADATPARPPPLLALLVLGIGMGLSTAPATESVMGSLPPGTRARLGDQRHLAGARHRPRRGGDRQHRRLRVPEPLRPRPRRGRGGAVAGRRPHGARVDRRGAVRGRAAGRVHRQRGRRRPEQAFVDGFHVGWWVVAATMLLSAVVALVFLPARAGVARPSEDAGPGAGPSDEAAPGAGAVDAEADPARSAA